MTDMLARRLTVSPQATDSRVADETVILHLGNDTYYGLDPAEPGFVRRRLELAGRLRDRVPVLAFDYPRRYDALGAARRALEAILEELG